MKLGLSQASYRWVAYPWLRTDSATYRYSTGRLPYFESVEPPDSAHDLSRWMIERTRAHGLTALYLDPGWFRDEAGAADLGAVMHEAGIEYFGLADPDLVADVDAWGATDTAARNSAGDDVCFRLSETAHRWQGGSEFQRCVRAMELAVAAGATIVNVVHREAGLKHRFIEDPPLSQQLDAMTRNLRSLIPIAEELGVVLTTESHMDYRVADFVQVMEAVASPWLRHNFDFANSISVVEDPLDAARLAAPYTVMTHIKDMRVQPYTLIGEPRFFHAPIGLGDVPVLDILEVLQQGAPDPDNLQHCVEVVTPPEHDAEAWLVASLDWLREHAAPYFS